MRFISRLASPILLILSLAATIAALGKDGPTIEKAVLVRAVGDEFEPVDSFRPTDIFGVLVFVNGGTPGTRVKGIWRVVEAGGKTNQTLLEKEAVLTAEALKAKEPPHRIDFSLLHDDAYPIGAYKTDFYVNDVLAKTVEFKIEILTYALDFCGTKQTKKPTEGDLRQAVAALDASKNDAFLVLSSADTTFIQVSGDKKTGFALEYQAGDVKHHYKAKSSDLTADQIVKALVSYAAGTKDWKKATEWELMEL